MNRIAWFTLSGVALILAGLLLWRATPLDVALHSAASLRHHGWWLRQALRATALGGIVVMLPLSIGAAILLAIRRRGREAAWLIATIAGGRLAVEGIKLVAQRPRPPAVDRLELVTSWSFPSAHSAGTTMTCVALALLAGGGRGAMSAALAAATIVGWTRIALGVHWPSDVLAGWGFGLLWVGVASRWLPAATPPPSRV